METQIVLTFEEHGGKTKFTLRYPGLEGLNAKDLENMRQGWNESIDKTRADTANARDIS